MKITDRAFAPIVEPKFESGPEKTSSGAFQSAFDSVREAMVDADSKAADAMVGKGSIHGAMIALTKADLGFRFLTQVRGKAIEAYQQLMNLRF
jgi:flagellar hook-basal body complex protein FliE